MCTVEQVCSWLTERGEPHVCDGDVVQLRAVTMEFVAGEDQEALRCQIQVTSTAPLTRMVDIVFEVSVLAGADVHLVGTGAVGRAVLWMQLADEQDRLRIAESLQRAAHSSHRDEILRRLWGVLAAARNGHDDRWDAASNRVVEMVEVGDRIFFDTDSTAIRADAQQTLARQAQWLNQYPNYAITIEGHADERGTREYNIALGARRAAATRDYLASRGVNAARVKTISYGKERPVATCDDISCWSQNRRAVTALAGAGS